MIYEIREYTAVPGKMNTLVQRFNEHTLALFKRHGMEVVFISKAEMGEGTNFEVVYVLRFDSYQDMADRWAALQADPDWVAARDASEKDGALVWRVSRRVLNPEAFNHP